MKSHFKKHWFWYSLTLLLIIGNLYFYLGMKWQANRVDKAEQNAESRCAERIKEAEKVFRIKHLGQGAPFFAEIIKEPLMKEELDKIRDLMQLLVRETKVTSVSLVDPGGRIMVNTNAQDEGKKASNFYSEKLLQGPESVYNEEGNEALFASNIWNGTTNLGRLIIHYSDFTMNVERGD